ncbi:porin [Sutterella sp.]|uniref:porin n=1 Tax=Sutterella sp. TaxID=1981025 RepID=UPI0026E0102D|nr:porin [Sutterella sp.]MDO5532819.1 porin [Sutterella sp.]
MKKTLVAVAMLGAFAGSAIAADVTLYGNIDTGLNYERIDKDNNTDTTNTFQMKSGQQAGSRWGLKGKEDLGNGYAVGFILESGFGSDDGSLEQGRLFRRESSLSLYTPFGQVSFGRFGSINQGVSSWGKIGMLSAFSTGYGSYVAQVGTTLKTASVYDNAIGYQTPSFAGVKVYAQYAMGNTKESSTAATELDGTENKSSKDRYYVIGATYNNGPLNLFFSVDSTNYRSWDATNNVSRGDVDDSLTVTLGGNYNFGVAKLHAGAQYMDEVSFSGIQGSLGKVKGYGLTVSASIPAFGGSALVGAGYMDLGEADSNATKFDFSRWVVSAGYDYMITKRTNVYAVASYTQDTYEVTGAADREPNAATAMVGLRHRF